jgi:hypothetical protein
MNQSNLTLNVNREKLVAELEAKRTELTDAYDAQIKAFADQIENLTNSGEAWAEYHDTISAGLREGHFVYGENGRIATTDKRSHPLPEKPNSARGTGNRQVLEQNQRYAGQNKKRALQPIDAALRLLRLSDAETIEIDSANYNGLLSQTVEERGYYY